MSGAWPPFPLCAALALAQAILPSPLFCYVKLLCTLMVEFMNGVGRKFSDMILLQISFKHILINLTCFVLHKNDLNGSITMCSQRNIILYSVRLHNHFII